MLLPIKKELTITPDEMLSLLEARCNGNMSTLTPEIIHEILQPYTKFALDVPEFMELGEEIEKEFAILQGKPLEIMKKFLDYMEKINNILKPYKPCKEGCAYCCSIPVHISNLEVVLIEEYLKINKITKYKKIIKSIDVFMKNKNDSIFGDKYVGKKCPFLENNICNIYNVRPYACRKYITFENDNDKCKKKEKNISLFVSDLIQQSYENIIKYWIAKVDMTKINYVPLDDIREYFEEI
ncbi:MAG: YkgJ family cysteine cluster protein [Treponema sp.]|nr:YkgJ family cysteine cluster protein [Treponema sp.]